MNGDSGNSEKELPLPVKRALRLRQYLQQEDAHANQPAPQIKFIYSSKVFIIEEPDEGKEQAK